MPPIGFDTGGLSAVVWCSSLVTVDLLLQVNLIIIAIDFIAIKPCYVFISQVDQPRVSKLLHQFAIVHCWLQQWLNVSKMKDRDTNSFIFLLVCSQCALLKSTVNMKKSGLTVLRSLDPRIKKQEHHKHFTLQRLSFEPFKNTIFPFIMVFRIQSTVF